MYASGFLFDLRTVDVRFRQDEVRSADFMLLRQRHDGGVNDQAFHRPRGTRMSEWSRVRFVLHGSVHVRRRGAPVEKRTIYGSGEFRTEGWRMLTQSSDWLDLYWRKGSRIGAALSGEVALRIPPNAFARAAALADALARRDVAAVRSITRDVVARLRAEGLPFERDAVDLGSDDDDRSSDFARVLWRMASRLETQPMAIDLAHALGVCERQALRRARHHFERFHLSASSWREFMNCLRVELGVFFMSSPSARTEVVSRFLGFSSPTSFCHALKEADLPSPLALQRELRSS
jgi:hypothetical protein